MSCYGAICFPWKRKSIDSFGVNGNESIPTWGKCCGYLMALLMPYCGDGFASVCVESPDNLLSFGDGSMRTPTAIAAAISLCYDVEGLEEHVYIHERRMVVITKRQPRRAPSS